jgi:predicted transcriptional regulator
MRQRKTDDEVILKMLREGKTQKEIAKHFGVSPVAIHKRVKRLLPPPESLRNLTEKEQKFALSVAGGKTQTQAALDSYDVTSTESAKVIGSQLMSKPEVRQAVDELMEFHGLSRSYRVRRLKGHVDNRDPNVSLKALDMSFKLDNSYPPARNINLNASVDLSPVDLSKYRNHYEGEERSDQRVGDDSED